MNRVISINLNGNAYQVDESGFNVLRQYLDAAAVSLKDNPDRAEVMADLEQAVADKCQKYLSAHKTVVSADEIAKIIAEMGPVDGEAGAPTEDKSKREEKPGDGTRRLYQIREGAMISGVCKGIAAYLNIDVTIVRVVFLILTFVTKGLWLAVYGVLMFVIPHATTSEERAAAHGKPFSAQDLIDGKEWKQQWREQRRAWRRKWRVESPWWGRNVQNSASYGSRIFATAMFPIFTIVNLGVIAVAMYAMFFLMRRGPFPNWGLSLGVWELLLIAFVLGIITAPMRAARRASYYAAGFGSNPAWAMWGGVFSLVWIAVGAWFAYQYIPQFQYIVNNLPEMMDNIFR